MTDFTPTAAFVALVITTINFLRHLRGQEWGGAATVASSWAAGVIAVMIAAQTDFASGIAVGDRSLEGLNLASQVFVGLSAASIASFVTDLKKAVDTTDSAVKPALFPTSAPKVVDPHG
jgi:hypothetical protein